MDTQQLLKELSEHLDELSDSERNFIDRASDAIFGKKKRNLLWSDEIKVLGDLEAGDAEVSETFYCFSCHLPRPMSDRVKKGKIVQCKRCVEVKRQGRPRVKRRLIDEARK